MPDDTTPQPELLEAPPESAGGAQTGTAEAAGETIERLQRERDEYYDLLLRTRAEFDNYRKRIDRERAEQAESAAAGLLRALLPILDDLERALAAPADEEGARAYREGVELIHRQLLELLQKHAVTPIEALGADFDPHRHQAVVHEPAPGHREGEIVEEFRRGYMLGNRLLRPSMVKVAAGD